MYRRIGNRRIRSGLTTAFLLLVALTSVALIGISPIALEVFHGATGKWERLSFIGQTYGAASAIISVLALVGIVFTLSYQAREAKLARERRDARPWVISSGWRWRIPISTSAGYRCPRPTTPRRVSNCSTRT
jgi:uncharacterized BrkB/YihY/UPF0761 family membrane protein